MTCNLQEDSYKDFNPDKTVEALDNLQDHIIDNLDKPELCPECGATLPKTKTEVRQGGYFEFVTECLECGATYTD